MWIGAIQDNDFAKRVLSSIEGQQAEYKTWTRMHGMLTMASEVSEANGSTEGPDVSLMWRIGARQSVLLHEQQDSRFHAHFLRTNLSRRVSNHSPPVGG
jgi:tRNA G26 N,N-dimethylase Trm1